MKGMPPSPPSASDPVVVWGGGAIGGTLAAYWARAGIPVLLVDIVPAHVEACRGTGLRIEGTVENFLQRVPAVLPEDLEGIYSRIVLAVKAQHSAAALDALLPHLADDGFILSAQNGLNETLIAERAGKARTMGCFVNFGADWLGPGRILYGGRGEVVVGEIDGSPRERTVEMHRLLSLFEPAAVLTDNIWGYLWGKLGFAALLFATSLNNDTMDANFADPDRFAVFDQLGREVMAVARKRGVAPVGITGFDPAAFMPGAPEAAARACMAVLAQRRRHSAKKHSGFWRDLAVRKRRTEVDELLGKVAEFGRAAGVATPALDALIALVHDIEDGRRKISHDTFEALRKQCEPGSRTTFAAQ
ncbi:MAG TPA: 2-dehydropantoate 2-reductase N-terminal domain-containing protein [Burkholderiales bacterium]|nr:2-dehydropantoate 2-reductase N-terminal domain-containing protein [Burkholderiales bacterium]